VEPDPETYLPAEHRPHSEDPNTLAKLPGVHGSQTDTVVAPSFPEKVPREHISQAVVPVSFPQLPPAQSAHVEVPAAAAKVPMSQDVQPVVEFGSNLNFPGSQSVHWETP
jgi:hypothetical protein